MLYDINQKDIELLKNAPDQLVLELQKLIDVIILKFIHSGKFNAREYSEIKQQVNECLLIKIPYIRKRFEGKSLLRTYMSVTIRNICNDILREKEKTKFVDYGHDHDTKGYNETMNALLIKEEMQRLKKIIELFYHQKYKLILCLKLRFRMPFNYEDLKNVNMCITKVDYKNFVRFVTPYEKCSNKILFEALTEVFNKFENKNNAPDTIRKWVYLKINEIIEILNGKPPLYRYDEETFQILFEKCYCQKEIIYNFN